MQFYTGKGLSKLKIFQLTEIKIEQSSVAIGIVPITPEEKKYGFYRYDFEKKVATDYDVVRILYVGI